LISTFILATKDYGPMLNWDLGTKDDPDSAVKFMDTYLAPYLKVAKNCGKSVDGVCGHKAKGLDGTDRVAFDNRYAKILLNNGVYVGLRISENNSRYKRVQVMIDVNGEKGPNKYGLDIFPFYYVIVFDYKIYNQIVFMGTGDIKTCITDSCNKNGSGTYCSQVIAKNGFEIPTKDQYVQWAGSEEYRALYPW